MSTSTIKKTYQIKIANPNGNSSEVENVGSLTSAYTPRDCVIERLIQLGDPQIIQGTDSFQTSAGQVSLESGFNANDIEVIKDYIRVANKAKQLGIRWTRIRETQYATISPSISQDSSRNIRFLSILLSVFVLIAVFGSPLSTMLNSEVPFWLVPALFGGTALAITPILIWQIIRSGKDRLIRESFKKSGEPVPYWV